MTSPSSLRVFLPKLKIKFSRAVSFSLWPRAMIASTILNLDEAVTKE